MWAGIEPSEAQATATATNLGLKMPLEPVITLLQGACRCIPPIMWSSRWRTRLHFNDHMAASQQRGCGIMTAIEAQAKCGTASTVDQRREGGCCSNATTCQRAEMPRRIFFAFPSIGATRCLPPVSVSPDRGPSVRVQRFACSSSDFFFFFSVGNFVERGPLPWAWRPRPKGSKAGWRLLGGGPFLRFRLLAFWWQDGRRFPTIQSRPASWQGASGCTVRQPRTLFRASSPNFPGGEWNRVATPSY